MKSKKIVDTSELLELAKQATKKTPAKKKEGEVQMISNNGKKKQVLPTFTVQSVQNQQRLVQARGIENRTNQPLMKEQRVFQQLPMPITQLYPILIERNLISPIVPRQYDGSPPRDFDPNATCEFHFGPIGHSLENCKVLKHQV